MIVANVLSHAGHAGLTFAGHNLEPVGTRLALALFAALITLIGGRVLSSFTRNWLAKAGHTRLPAPFGRFDKFALAIGVASLLAWVFAPMSPITAELLALAAIAHAVRLSRWHGVSTWREPLLVEGTEQEGDLLGEGRCVLVGRCVDQHELMMFARVARHEDDPRGQVAERAAVRDRQPHDVGIERQHRVHVVGVQA